MPKGTPATPATKRAAKVAAGKSPPRKSKPPKRTRQEAFAPTQVAEALRLNNGNVSAAARVLGCCWDTVQAYCQRYPEVQAARERGLDVRLDNAEAALDAAVEAREGWAVCFLLKTRGKHRGYVERSEIVGSLEVIPPYVPRRRG